MNGQGQQHGCECPSIELLSAWHDGEGSDEIARHVERCAACRKAVEFYAGIDAAVSAACQPSPDLAVRISRACRNLQREPLQFAWGARLLRAAAGIALIAAAAAVIAMIATRDGTSGRPAQLTTLPEQTPSDDAPQTADTARRTAPVYRTVYYNRLDGPAPLARVGAETSDFPDSIAQRLMPQPQRSITILQNSVNHVWVVDDLDVARQQVLDLLPAGASAMCVTPQARALRLHITLTDQQLQALVNRLEARGWALVTPNLPQPGQIDRLQLTGDQVVYVADIVMR